MPTGRISGGYVAKVFISKGCEETGRIEKKTDRVYLASICGGTSTY
jgi:hypothetical protein